jgi:hypothetical protein
MKNVKNNVNVLRYTVAIYVKRNRYYRLRLSNVFLNTANRYMTLQYLSIITTVMSYDKSWFCV